MSMQNFVIESVTEVEGITVLTTKDLFVVLSGGFAAMLATITNEDGSVEIKPCVVVHEDARLFFSHEEFKALVYHELGHISLNHINAQPESYSEKKTGYLNRIEYELEADSYAAEHTSAELVKQALLKLKKFWKSDFAKNEIFKHHGFIHGNIIMFLNHICIQQPLNQRISKLA